MKKSRTKHTTTPPTEIPESLAALAGGMADDFNNILTTVMGACSLIDREDPGNNELLKYVAIIRASAERAAALSNRLMLAGSLELDGNSSESHHQNLESISTSVRDKNTVHDIVSGSNHPDEALK